MSIRTFSSREFTRDVASAKRATANGPVFITDRGQPRYVLQTIEDYYAHTGSANGSLLDLMNAIPGGDGIDFEPLRAPIALRTADLDESRDTAADD